MQVILLATGEFDKLHPLTKSRPSPLVTIANQPMMEIVIEQLARANIKQILVCLHHDADMIETYFRDGRRWGVSMDYVLLREEWGNAGVLLWVKPLITETFLVMPADMVVDFDINSALSQHLDQKNSATAVIHNNASNLFKIPDRNCISSDENSTKEIHLQKGGIETGVYIFEPSILDWIPPRKKYDISSQLLPALAHEGLTIGSYTICGYWNPLESLQDFREAQKFFLYSFWENCRLPTADIQLNPSSISGQKEAPGIWIGRNNQIHPSVRLTPPVLLGENIRIASGVELGPEVVIGSNVIIADGASIHHSTIFDHTYIGKYICLQDRIVDKNLVIDINSTEHIVVTDQFLLDEIPDTLEEQLIFRVFDTTIAFIILLLTLPLTLPLGLILKISNGKAIQTIDCMKTGPASSNTSNSTNYPVYRLVHFNIRNDSGRTNRFGNLIERLEWHRLPELWNVIAGDMRLVGIRPLSTKEFQTLEEVWQQDHRNHYSGFTGLWYLEKRRCREPSEMVIADVYYGATRTWMEDMRILMKTPFAWLSNIRMDSSDCVSREEV